MKVFLSWSGSRSKAVAEAFAEWLPQVIQSVDPWLSKDIDKGVRWSAEIAEQLESTRVGIICLTEDNLTAPWILFESGALSKTREAHVCTFLLDVRPASVEPPLGQFQHTTFDKADVYRLLQTINTETNRSGERALADNQLEAAFDVWWPRLENQLKAIPSQGNKKAAGKRHDRELFEEMLEILRGMQRPVVAIQPLPPPESLKRYAVTIKNAVDWPKDRKEALLGNLKDRLGNVVSARWSNDDLDLRLNLTTEGPALTNLKAAAKTLTDLRNATVVRLKRQAS